MSRIGNRIIEIPSGVSVSVNALNLQVKGPLGSLEIPFAINNPLKVEIADNKISIKRINDLKQNKMLHGTFNALVKNAIIGVTEGFSKQLQLVGVGYRAALKGTDLSLSLGYSHPIELKIPKDIKVTVEKNTLITISGSDKQHVGEFAIQVRK